MTSKYLILIPVFALASWYNYSLPGYPNYGKYNLTAASRDYPRKTRLEVCTADGEKRCVVVRVNDYVENPKVSIDLSQAAFKRLAPLSKGLLKVNIKKL